MKRSIFIFAALCALLASCAGKTDRIELCRVDPLLKIVPGDTSYTDISDTVMVARGENALVQIVVTNTSADSIACLKHSVRQNLGEARTGWVHNVACYNRPWGADDMLVSSDDTFPDPIFDDIEESLAPGGRAVLWVDISIPRDAKPGLYKGCVRVSDGCGSVTRDFTVKVYPVTLPETQGLTVVNWYYDHSLSWMNNCEPVELYSEKYYDFLGTIADMTSQYGQNCWLIRNKPEIIVNSDSTGLAVDFSAFDRTVETFIEHGNLRMINCGHFGGRNDGSQWRDAFGFSGVEFKDGAINQYWTDVDDPRLAEYINWYFPILKQHLEEKGWFDMYVQHIADEPDAYGTPSHESWVKMARMIKDAAPGIRIMEASFDILEGQDIMVPVLGSSIADYAPAPEGKERWLYTCTGPQGNFANRFIHQPLLKPRLLHWVNYKYNATGYLHWGLNWWEGCDDPVHNATPHTDWPCGDCYIIYPGNGKVYPTIRLCAMRDGIRDYDLLKMAESKDPAKAKEIIDSAIFGPDSYVSDIAGFRQIRKTLLDFLSE